MRAMLEAGLMVISFVAVVGCGRSPSSQSPPLTTADRTPAVPVRVRGTMPSVEESLARHGYFFYEPRPGSFFNEEKPLPTAQHRISIKPSQPSPLRMRFDLEADGTTIRSCSLTGNSLERDFLFELDKVSIPLNSEFKNKEFDASQSLGYRIYEAASPEYANFKTSRVGSWVVERAPGGTDESRTVIIRRDVGTQ